MLKTSIFLEKKEKWSKLKASNERVSSPKNSKTYQVRYHGDIVKWEKPAPADATPVVIRQAPYKTLDVRGTERLMEFRVHRRYHEFLEIVPGGTVRLVKVIGR